MRSIPRSGQTRTALICKKASYKFPSCGVYKDKAIAPTQSAIEPGENVSILNPDKYFCIVFLIVFPFLLRALLPIFPLLMRMLLPHILFCFFFI